MAFHNFGLLMVKLVQWKSRNKRTDKSYLEEVNQDVTVVVEDYSASGPREMSVQRGQQVEIVDASSGQVDWCVVRTLSPEGGESSQGLVPMCVLKPISFLQTPGARNSIDLDDSLCNPEGTSSPVSKRRSSFKKWLTTPVRKLSHGKIEKQGAVLLESQKSLQRRQANNSLGADKDSAGGETTPTADQAAAPPFAVVAAKAPLNSTNEDEEPAQDIEMPPPMAIQDHIFKPEKDVSTDDVTAKLASQLSLKPQADSTTNVDPTNHSENVVPDVGLVDPSQEMAADQLTTHEMTTEADQESTQTVDHCTKEEEEEEDKADCEEKDVEAEKVKSLKKRQFVVQELYDTEKDYVKDLASIVDGYMAYMRDNPLPAEMEGKDKIVFGNIHQIYDWHNETMLAELEKCLANNNKVGSIFVRYERRLYMYVKYCENKPKSEHVVSEYLDTYFEEVRQKLGHRLMLPDLLIKPVQRIMRYQLLLKDILKYTEKAEEDTSDLRRALHVMCVVPKAANDMMQVGRLQGFDGKITAQGKLLLQDTLLVSEASSGGQQKFKERRVFLFEQIIIFSEMIESKRGNFFNATCIYKNSLKVNKMSLFDTVEGDPLRFQLTDRTPGSDSRMIIQANSEENKESWVKQIRSILDMQGDFLRALQSPIAYQKELTKELSSPDFNNSGAGESALRKTKSHPMNRVHNLSSSNSLTGKTHSDTTGFKSQNDRCKSVPSPFLQSTVGPPVDGSRLQSYEKGSSSPLVTKKDIMHSNIEGKGGKYSSSNVPDVTSSPKPKKTIFDGFRNTLGRKSKSSQLTSGRPAEPATTPSPQSPSKASEGIDSSTPLLAGNEECSDASSTAFESAEDAAADSSASSSSATITRPSTSPSGQRNGRILNS